jgi:hypothetical protein
MIALDGNAIAGDLIEALGIDLAATTCVCASCGTSGFFAEAVVYTRGPGRVARCRTCTRCSWFDDPHRVRRSERHREPRPPRSWRISARHFDR